MYSIGIDLAWKSNNPSGICISDEEGNLQILEVGVFSNEDLVSLCTPYLVDFSVVAIDAPLIVPNKNGIRSCELEFKKQKIHGQSVSILASNQSFLLKQFGEIRGADLVQMFTDTFAENGVLTAKIIETFPTATVIGLFKRKIPYKLSKAGNKNEMLNGMKELILEMKNVVWFDRILKQSRFEENFYLIKNGTVKDLKRFEDLLDAILCAHTAFHYLNKKINKKLVLRYREIFGDKSDGSIVFSLVF